MPLRTTRFTALNPNYAKVDMRMIYEAIKESLDECRDELIDRRVRPSGDPVELLNNIITPLFVAARRGEERGKWDAEISFSPNAPTLSEPTVQIEFWSTHEERASAANIMAYPDSNEFIDSGIVVAYSVKGSNVLQEMQLLPLNRYNPSGACSIIKESIQRALSVDLS